MIKVITAYTEEVDEIDDGIAEILGQINLDSLKKNSVGLVTCHFDFTQTGFIDKLCQKLPFDIIGMTTMASANQYGQSMYSLSLTVLTSDDVVFETSMTGALNFGNFQQEIKDVYSGTVKKLPGDPSFIITFFPFIKDVSGALMHKSFNETCKGIPFWGSLATNIDVSFESCSVLRNNETNKEGVAMILLHGPVDPEFVVVSLPLQNIWKNRGKITDSDGCVLKAVNGMPPLKYMETLGVVIRLDSSIVTPLMVYYEGSSEPVALGVYAVNEDGSALCGGEMPVGAGITIGEITTPGILESTTEGINRVLQTGKRSGALMLPCVSRYVMLSPQHNEEMTLIIDKMENEKSLPFMVGYSGGELCPVRDENGVWQNRFHNFSFTACVL